MRKITIFAVSIAFAIGIATQVTRLSADVDGQTDQKAAASTRDSATGNKAANRKADREVDGKFVVHEWGTFTTFSGSDGVFLDFRPLAAQHSDLPNYVIDRGTYSQVGIFTKSRLWGRVRMETPVTYFYTDRVRSVDVRVDFPKGLLTEFYPPVQSLMPAIDEKNIFGKGEVVGDSSLDWGTVDLIPVDQLVADESDPDRKRRIQSGIVERLLPHGPNEQHYAEARATDSALVHFRGKSGMYSAEQDFFEKFLFYRGVGKFQLPVSARFQKSGIVMNNDGSLPIRSAILVRVDGESISATKLDRIDAGQSLKFEAAKSMSESELADLVEESLVAEGLYKKEATSMVKTWQNSWFTENGSRILYMVPASTTDELLPLHVNPQPQKTVRVLVGRMELMSPESEKKMIGAVASSAKLRAQHHADQKNAANKKAFAIPKQILDFGRMAEPALVRVAKITSDEGVRREAELLVQQFLAM